MNKIKIIEKEDKLFPEKLKQVRPEVKKIYVQGNEKILNQFGIAIVGSRNSSKEGEKNTDTLITGLSKYKINIISGLAIGIDTIAHKSSLMNNCKTIAVLGSGFNHIYPKENIRLYEKIIEQGGAIISEYEPNENVNPKNFPKRNRIISSLCDGLIVIEGKIGSGTGITAKQAQKLNKPIFCIPHSINNSYGYIPNDVIKKGGMLITDYKEIINYYQKKNINIEQNNKKEKEDNPIIKLLEKENILTKEEIRKKLKIDIALLNKQLTILELKGNIKEIHRERIYDN